MPRDGYRTFQTIRNRRCLHGDVYVNTREVCDWLDGEARVERARAEAAAPIEKLRKIERADTLDAIVERLGELGR